MQNIATIYRFNTPFLDVDAEKKSLVSVIKKIRKSIEFDGIKSKQTVRKLPSYHKVTLLLEGNLGRIEFYYLADGVVEYYYPVFKMNVYIERDFGEDKKNIVSFLNNIFECFDGVNEREFLIDIDSSIFYNSGLFRAKVYPHHDFSDIEEIQKRFEGEDGLELVEDFTRNFSKTDFVLTIYKAQYYHRLHSIFVYFVYLIFLMNQTLMRTRSASKQIDKLSDQEVYEDHISLMRSRLSYVHDLQTQTFEQYKDRLELFFKLF